MSQFDFKQLRRMKNVNIPTGGGGMGGIGMLVGGALVLTVLGVKSLYNVEGGHRAVKFNRFTGIGSRIYGEGTHVAFPFVERPIIYNVRTRPRNISAPTGSRDLQVVNVSLRVLHRPDERCLPDIYRHLGYDYDERVLPSIGNEVMKSVVAQYNASELLTKREEVSRHISDRLTERAREFNIIVDDVSIVHLGFGKEYTAAIEAKQVAQQEAERAKFLVEKALQDKRAVIIKAEGEAQSAELIGEAMKKNPAFLELRRIEAAHTIADTVSKSSNRVYIPSDTLLLNVTKKQ